MYMYFFFQGLYHLSIGMGISTNRVLEDKHGYQVLISDKVND